MLLPNKAFDFRPKFGCNVNYSAINDQIFVLFKELLLSL